MVVMKTLNDAINDYAARAANLETEKLKLVEDISKVVLAEIIPEVNYLLPAEYIVDNEFGIYPIDVKKPAVWNSPAGVVPTGFVVHLRLLYNHKPIPQMQSDDHLDKALNKAVNSELKQMAKKYGLVSIDPLPDDLLATYTF